MTNIQWISGNILPDETDCYIAETKISRNGEVTGRVKYLQYLKGSDHFLYLEEGEIVERYLVESPSSIEGEEKIGFGLSEDDVKKLLDAGLKPEEIGGDQRTQLLRVKELVRWFRRCLDGNANPKWFQSHTYELVYYIVTNAGNRFIDLKE